MNEVHVTFDQTFEECFHMISLPNRFGRASQPFVELGRDFSDGISIILPPRARADNEYKKCGPENA